ncbi:MAG: carbon starvation protein A, partial [Rubrobacter sp.]|nr:carbon starvation protein A [Rubrobacter sp.]
MPAIFVVVVVLILFFFGYRYYSKYLAEKVFELDKQFVTPAHEFEDGVDYVPTNKHILFGHHFTSVAGAAPITGPAIAVFWGWMPALLWVVLGTIFASGVHDFGSIVVSVRNRA